MTSVTIDLPDELHDLGEAFAEALRRMPPEAIRAYLEDVADDAWCAEQARTVKRRIASGESRWVEWSETEAKLDALPDRALA